MVSQGPGSADKGWALGRRDGAPLAWQAPYLTPAMPLSLSALRLGKLLADAGKWCQASKEWGAGNEFLCAHAALRVQELCGK